MGMHADELEVDADLVRGLIAEQFPQWTALPVHRVAGAGTDNAIVRIGDDLVARLPLRPADPTTQLAEVVGASEAMRELAEVVSVRTPKPVAIGAPGCGYPLSWSVQTWVPGEVATPTSVAESDDFARDLADLIRSLRAADTHGRTFAGRGRGGDLTESDEWMQVCFERSEGILPVDELRALWAEFRSLPSSGAEVMSHRDLIPGNVLVAGARLTGVLDGGGFSPADPALDLVGGWHMLDARRRALLRSDLGCGDLEWRRGAAWAFQQAMGLVWYYRESNPAMAELGRTTLSRLLADRRADH